MSCIALDEGVPAGIIVQLTSADFAARTPMLQAPELRMIPTRGKRSRG